VVGGACLAEWGGVRQPPGAPLRRGGHPAASADRIDGGTKEGESRRDPGVRCRCFLARDPVVRRCARYRGRRSSVRAVSRAGARRLARFGAALRSGACGQSGRSRAASKGTRTWGSPVAIRGSVGAVSWLAIRWFDVEPGIGVEGRAFGRCRGPAHGVWRVRRGAPLGGVRAEHSVRGSHRRGHGGGGVPSQSRGPPARFPRSRLDRSTLSPIPGPKVERPAAAAANGAKTPQLRARIDADQGSAASP
jgi:hypothetical protein